MKIIHITVQNRTHSIRQQIKRADIAIGPDRVVFKEKLWKGPRPATAEELAAAEKVTA